MAEGGGQGLASALTIAFAKGYLMPRIKSHSFSDDSPAEIVRGLKSHLVQKMAHDHELGFIYAVFDSSDNSFRFAKTGASPTVHINTQSIESNPRQGELNELKFSLSDDEYFVLTEGLYHLENGDTITLLTDGLSQVLSADNAPKMNSFWQTIAAGSHSQTNLQAAVQASARQLSEVTDDLTVVSIHINNGEGGNQ